MRAGTGQQWWRKHNDERDTLPWKFNEGATRYLQELLTTEPLHVPVVDEDVDTVVDEEVDDRGTPGGHLEVYQLKCTLQDDEHVTSSALVLPPSTRGMWQAVLEATCTDLARHRVLVIGTPGVGKSRSMNYFLKLVIDRRRQEHSAKLPLPVIVFEHRKDKVTWLFAPKDPNEQNSEYEAFSLHQQHFIQVVAAVRCATNYLLVDTSQAENAKMPGLYPCNTVYVCSPDPRHYSEYRKHISGNSYFFPHWREGDILAAREYAMTPGKTLSEKEVRERMTVVGPIPRRVFADNWDYVSFKRRVDNAMTNHQKDIEQVIRGGAYKIDLEGGHPDKPRSSVFMIGVMQGSDYRAPYPVFVSDYARSKLGKNILTLVLTLADTHTFSDSLLGDELWKLWEILVMQVLNFGWEGQCEWLSRERGAKERFPIKVKKRDVSSYESVAAEGKESIRNAMVRRMKCMDCFDISDPEKQNPLQPPVFVGGKFPLIDAAVARNMGFDMTCGVSKQWKSKAAEKLLQDLGVKSMYVVYALPASKYETFEVSGKTNAGKFHLLKVRITKKDIDNMFSEK